MPCTTAPQLAYHCYKMQLERNESAVYNRTICCNQVVDRAKYVAGFLSTIREMEEYHQGGWGCDLCEHESVNKCEGV